MKFSKVLALFVILAMVGVASGAAIIPSSYDMNSLTTGVSSHGQEDFVAGLYYGAGDGLAHATGGLAGGPAIGGGGAIMGGAAVNISNGTGVVDITLDMSGGNADKHVRVAGDGTYATALNYVDIRVTQLSYSYGYEYIIDKILGNGIDTSYWSPGVSAPANYLQIHFNVDIPNNTMLIELYDIDDSTGVYNGGWFKTIWTGASPFATSVDVVEFGADWQSPRVGMFDNLVLTPEPATLSVLVLAGVLSALLRRRR